MVTVTVKKSYSPITLVLNTEAEAVALWNVLNAKSTRTLEAYAAKRSLGFAGLVDMKTNLFNALHAVTGKLG